jgi:hypothetical protein
MEMWEDIKDYEGLYQISNLGNVKSIKKGIVVGDIIKGGYRRIPLYKNGKYKRFMIHRLVAEAFVKNPDNKPEIDHIDGNSLNNMADNLRWCSHKENLNNPITLKRKSIAQLGNHMTGRFGALHHNSKKVLCIETKTVYGGIAEAERQTGIKHISNVCCGSRQTAGGYHWQYL